jgi:hypothetical protein
MSLDVCTISLNAYLVTIPIQLSSILNRAYFKQERSLVRGERKIYICEYRPSKSLPASGCTVTVGSVQCVHSADFQRLFHDFSRNNILNSKTHLSNVLKASAYLTRKHTTCLLQRPITLCYVESQKTKTVVKMNS